MAKGYKKKKRLKLKLGRPNLKYKKNYLSREL